MRIDLPYGARPRSVEVGGRVQLVDAPSLPAAVPVGRALADALERPIDSPPLEQLARAGDRVTVIVSDATRDEPRADLLAAVRARLPAVRLTVAIATGTHGPCGVEGLGLGATAMGARIVNHDGHRDDDLVDLGVTARGTPIRIHRCAVEADLVIATGAIRPHYFAGWGAGAKAIFPGLGQAAAVRINHRWKAAPGAIAGAIAGNPCRDDLEEAARAIPARRFLLDVLGAPRALAPGHVMGAVAGDVDAAWRAGASRCLPWFAVRARRSSIIVASDALPVTASLYQAAKIVAAVAPLAVAGGAIILAAECSDGIGPVATVNEAIFALGIQPRLPRDCAVYLLSSLPSEIAARGFAIPIDSIDGLVGDGSREVAVIPRASQLVISATD